MIIRIPVKNKIPSNPDRSVIVCDNTDYKLKVEFDTEWEAYPNRTALYVWEREESSYGWDRSKKTYSKEITFTGSIVDVPILEDINEVTIGFYAGDLCTTVPLKIVCKPSILSLGHGNAALPSAHYVKLKDEMEKLIAEISTALQNEIDSLSIPTALSQLEEDAEHRTVSDAEKEAWSQQQVQASAYANEAKLAAGQAIQAAEQAAESKQAAATKAGEAATSASNAAASADRASESATAASEAASTATEKATEASTSAEQAATSASEAQTAAQEAATAAESATNAVEKHNELENAHLKMRKMLIDQLAPEFHEKAPIVQGHLVANYPMQVMSHIIPIQGGEGDPAPENVRPIKGWDKAQMTVCGINLAKRYVARDTDRYSTAIFADVPLKPNTDYVLTFKSNAGNAYYTNEWVFGYKPITTTSGINTVIVKTLATLPNPITNYGFSGYVILKNNADNAGNSISDVQIELSTEATPYTPYSGEDFAVSFSETVFGGVYDWVAGTLTVTHKNIPSYNGEAVGEEWISSTGQLSTGAQVVYKLDEPITKQLDQKQVLSLNGINTLCSNSGDTEVFGRVNPNHIFQTQESRIAALEEAISKMMEVV